MKNHKRAWARIDLAGLGRNINTIKQHLSSSTEIMAVVKADAYGHGENEVIKKLYSTGIRYFAVSNLDEAISVRDIITDCEILILGYTPPEYADELIKYNIIQCAVSEDYAKELNRLAPSPVRCHIKLDTGMGRIGLKFKTVSECADCAERIASLENIAAEGLFTHFAVADSDDPENVKYTEKQAEFIKGVYYELANRGIKLKHVHFLNSAGAAYHFDGVSTLARIGITMYGLLPNYPLPLPYKVEPVMELKAVISYVKTVEPGDCISYGRTYTASEERKIATVTVGYADGYSRLLSSKGKVLLKGKRCPIVGRVCMDQLMIDVTGIDAKPGDTVTLIGRDGDDIITADELASWYGTIGYEVVCGISKRVPRIYED
ncbi:MAG: alanine racemase [Oscillospiraceae bacterium]|nr:alanine racemase [Oscillospiraceae bacterium]MBP1568664.1 alanine racemase [Oscillospiraceae bacterium]